jgi:hypothetical protein
MFQLFRLGPPGSVGGKFVLPSWATCTKLGGSGRPPSRRPVIATEPPPPAPAAERRARRDAAADAVCDGGDPQRPRAARAARATPSRFGARHPSTLRRRRQPSADAGEGTTWRRGSSSGWTGSRIARALDAPHAPVRPARKHHDARAASIGEGDAALESTAAGTARFATAGQFYHGCGRFHPQLPNQAIRKGSGASPGLPTRQPPCNRFGTPSSYRAFVSGPPRGVLRPRKEAPAFPAS